MIQAVLHGLRVFVCNECVVGGGSGTGFGIDAQLDDRTEFAENHRQFVFGGLGRYIAEEQLVTVAERLSVAWPTINRCVQRKKQARVLCYCSLICEIRFYFVD